MTPNCPFCEKPSVAITAVIRYRRGDRVLPVETAQWACPTGCEGPGGKVRYTFADLNTMRANEVKAAVEWQRQFGEPMPPAGRAGRPTVSALTEKLQVRLTTAEVARLDAERGALSRSAYARLKLIEPENGGEGPSIARSPPTAGGVPKGREPRPG